MTFDLVPIDTRSFTSDRLNDCPEARGDCSLTFISADEIQRNVGFFTITIAIISLSC